MATLNLWNSFSLVAQGSEKTGKQGTTTDAPQDPFAVTVTGTFLGQTGTLATATVATIYDSSVDAPATFNYLFFWSDQDCYIQLRSSGTNSIHKITAKTPYCLSTQDFKGAAVTTIITGGTEPTLQSVTSVVIGNYSGSTMNYQFAVVD